jgi:Protein of unknown function (DUF1329)
MNRILRFTTAALLGGLTLGAAAAVTADEAKQLGTTLTPWGAEMAGNKDGSIPAYAPVQIGVPSSYDPKKPGRRPDPFASEKPLYTVTAQNMDQYADKLSEGAKAMLKKYPTFKMDVYPTHRTARYPAYVLENTAKNATACKSTNGGVSVEGCYGGILFPIPKNGNEVMWNHLVAYTSPSYSGDFQAVVVDSNGNGIVQGINDSWVEYPPFYADQKGVLPAEMIYWAVRLDSTEPARKAGEKVILVDYLDQVKTGRKAWQYLPGQRRVKLAPDLSYDTPNPQAGGASTVDESYGFIGAQDRYDFKLVGKKEMLIQYNNYKYYDPATCPEARRYMKGHPAEECMRWELHRVWEVEATLKSGTRHLYPKRKFYFDEDQPKAGSVDNYDATGKVYRVVFSNFIPWYETADQGSADHYTVHDLLTTTWFSGADHSVKNGLYPTPRKPLRFFTGDALSADGIR